MIRSKFIIRFIFSVTFRAVICFRKLYLTFILLKFIKKIRIYSVVWTDRENFSIRFYEPQARFIAIQQLTDFFCAIKAVPRSSKNSLRSSSEHQSVLNSGFRSFY